MCMKFSCDRKSTTRVTTISLQRWPETGQMERRCRTAWENRVTSLQISPLKVRSYRTVYQFRCCFGLTCKVIDAGVLVQYSFAFQLYEGFGRCLCWIACTSWINFFQNHTSRFQLHKCAGVLGIAEQRLWQSSRRHSETRSSPVWWHHKSTNRAPAASHVTQLYLARCSTEERKSQI